MADLFLIKGETLKSTADKIREYLGLENYSIDHEVVANGRPIKWLESDSVIVFYREMIDDPDGCYEGEGMNVPFGDAIIAYTYLENNEGIIVPVLYKSSNPIPDTEEPFFYVGKAEIDGETFDKWRKIETGDGFTWESEATQYIYTNPIVTVNSNVDGIGPYNFPSKIDDVYEAGYAKGQETGGSSGESMLGTWVFNDEITSAIDIIDTQEKYDAFDRGDWQSYSLVGYTTLPDGTKMHFTNFKCVVINGTFDVYGYIETFENYFKVYETNNDLFIYNGSWDTKNDINITEEPSAKVSAWIRANAKKKSYDEGYNEGYDAGYDVGYDEGYDARKPILQFKTAMPSNKPVTVTADATYDGLSEVVVAGDTKLVPENIVKGASIFMVNGTAKTYDEGALSVITDLIERRTDKTGLFWSCYFLTDERLNYYSNYLSNLGADISNMFYNCQSLTTIPLLDTSNVNIMKYAFAGCSNLITIPSLNTSKVTSLDYAFMYCSNLKIIECLDVRNVVGFSYTFMSCSALTDVRLRNIKTNLQVGSGTSWGHLLTVDSLVHLIYELRDTGSSKTLTVGSANLNKLANVYVKLVSITDEMRADDDLIDEKLPFVVCESTDAEAIPITDYVLDKNWQIK